MNTINLRRTGRPLGPMLQLVTFAALVNLLVGLGVMGAQAGETGKPLRVVAFGDSLTAGYMLKPSLSFPAQLAKALEAKGRPVEMINAGVSGDTTAAGLERLDWSVPEGTEAVILELGANDALRGQPPAEARANLERIILKLKERKIPVLLAGMAAPRNWGGDYADEFNAIYTELAKAHDLVLYPFFLEGVALKPGLNLPDGLHPTGEGIAVIVERILPAVLSLLDRAEAQRVASSKS